MSHGPVSGGVMGYGHPSWLLAHPGRKLSLRKDRKWNQSFTINSRARPERIGSGEEFKWARKQDGLGRVDDAGEDREKPSLPRREGLNRMRKIDGSGVLCHEIKPLSGRPEKLGLT